MLRLSFRLRVQCRAHLVNYRKFLAAQFTGEDTEFQFRRATSPGMGTKSCFAAVRAGRRPRFYLLRRLSFFQQRG